MDVSRQNGTCRPTQECHMAFRVGERHMMFCESAMAHAVLFAWKATGRKQLQYYAWLLYYSALVPRIM